MMVIDAGVVGETGELLQIFILINSMISPASRAGGGAEAGVEAPPLPAGARAGGKESNCSMKKKAAAKSIATAKTAATVMTQGMDVESTRMI